MIMTDELDCPIIEAEKDLPVLLNSADLAEWVEDIVWELDCSHLEAVVVFCDRRSIEVEDIARLISKPLKEKIEFDAMAAGMLKKSAQLPF